MIKHRILKKIGLVLCAFIAYFLNSSANAQTSVGSLISKAQYEELFPYRHGYNTGTGQREGDFFSYDNFIEAVNRMSKIEVKFERRCSTNAYKVTRKDKTTGVETVIREDDAFRNSSASIITEIVNYGDFCGYGSTTVRKRELMAFLANIAQETTGGWATAPGGQYAWGLHWKEEMNHNDNSMAYREEGHMIYPPAPGKSYHGRGPIQLSWNYNYGQMSEFLYGNKSVLLNNPERVTQDGALAFQTALWFWMTPQYPKVSCHDAMTGKWTPTADQISKGLIAGFGATVNIINGGIECGSGTENTKVVNRIGHYSRFCQIAGVSTALDGTNSTIELGCAKMPDFQINYQECSGGSGGGENPGGGGETPGGGGEIPGGVHCGSSAWNATKVYNTGDKAYYEGYVYTANFWNQGSRPDQNHAAFGQPWKDRTPCSEGGGGGGTTNRPPTVSISNPAQGANLTTSSVQVRSTATDPDGTISKVEFYLNGALKGTKNAAPFDYTVTGLSSGSNTLMVKAFDNMNESASSSVTVTYGSVTPPPVDVIPSVTITSPATGSTVNSPSTSVTAHATATGGTISKVEFYLNNVMIQTATNAPYTATANGLMNGANTIMAKAFSNTGHSSTASVSVNYSVSGGGGGTGDCQGVAAWISNKVYNTGDQARDGDVIYKANYWTQGNKPSENQGSGKPWAVVSKCDGTLDDSAFGETVNCGGQTVLVWKANNAYDKKDIRVFYNGNVYLSKWWTQGNVPGASEAWQLVGPCN